MFSLQCVHATKTKYLLIFRENLQSPFKCEYTNIKNNLNYRLLNALENCLIKKTNKQTISQLYVSYNCFILCSECRHSLSFTLTVH